MKKFIFPILFLLSGVLYAEDYAKFFSVVRDATGAAVDGATITVYDAGTVNVSVIYSDLIGTPKGNPFVSDSQGNYDFFVTPGLYKISATKIGVGTFTTDNIQIGTALHAPRHEDGGGDALDVSSVSGTHPDAQKVAVESNGVASDTENTIDFVSSVTVAPVVTPGTGKVAVGFGVQNDSIDENHLKVDSVGTSELAASAVYNENVSATAAVAESKLALNYPTHSNTNDPTANQKAAMTGTFGSPNGTNRFVTDQDSRMTNSRTPSAHAATHGNGQSDEVSIDVTQITTGVDAGTDLTANLEEETHATEHQNGGADEISVAGLSGELTDAQPVDVSLGGTLVGTRSKINLIEGGNAFLTVADNPGSDRIDVTIAGIGVASMTVAESDANPEVAAVNKINFDQVDGFTVTDNGGGEVTIGVSVIGEALDRYFAGPPASPGTPDDEFGSGTLAGKWTAVEGSAGTVSAWETGATIEKYDLTSHTGWLLMQAGSTTAYNVQLRQDYTLGDGDAIIAKLAPGIQSDGPNNHWQCGIALNNTDSTALTGTYSLMYIDTDTGSSTRLLYFDGVEHGSISTADGEEDVWLGIYRSGLNYWGFASVNGGETVMTFEVDTVGSAHDNLWLICLTGATQNTNAPLPVTAWDWVRLCSGGNPYNCGW